jgi:hypothetical protein
MQNVTENTVEEHGTQTRDNNSPRLRGIASNQYPYWALNPNDKEIRLFNSANPQKLMGSSAAHSAITHQRTVEVYLSGELKATGRKPSTWRGASLFDMLLRHRLKYSKEPSGMIYSILGLDFARGPESNPNRLQR